MALGASALAVIGVARAGGSAIYLRAPGSVPTLLYSHERDAHVAALARDETLIAIAHSEPGDSRHRALRVVRPDGTSAGELWDGPGRGLGGSWGGPDKGFPGVAFAPLTGDSRLLVTHERHDSPGLLIWDVSTGEQQEIPLGLPGEVSAGWYPDGRALLVAHAYHARDELYRYDLGSARLSRLDTPRGVIRGASARTDGTVEFAWSCAALPPSIRSTTGAVVLTPDAPSAPPSVPVRDVWVNGPGGPIHALVSAPANAAGRDQCVFLVHGGPIGYDDDAYDPSVAAWVDHGFVVVQVNYRGSTGYGSRWRDAIERRPGRTELEDVKAVRDWAVSSGLADPRRLVLTGRSWGGYLTLLGLGIHPRDWSAGIAMLPVADYVAAYQDEMEALQAFDRSLFGGSPAELPDQYRAASPITYVDRVTAPVLLIAGENDPRCPIRQIENYVAGLSGLGTPHQIYRYDAGHGSLIAEESIRQQALAIEFARRHLSGS